MKSLSTLKMADPTGEIEPSSLNDVPPLSVRQSKDTDSGHCAKALPFQKIEVEKLWNVWKLLDEPDMLPSHEVLSSSKRDRGADMQATGGASFAGSAATEKKSRYDQAMAEVTPDKVSMPDDSQDCSAGSGANLCLYWLNNVCPLLSAYDATLLHRYIPSLPHSSLYIVVAVFHSERITYLASDAYLASKKEEHEQSAAEGQVSKMAMRRILTTTFARLAPDDSFVLEVHRQWEATKNKSTRKGGGLSTATHRAVVPA